MTVPMPCPPPPPALCETTSSAPRKRRRRAPASGASDDCFACSKRNTKCDRRRPYCSQCLEVGNECSGYKTQLTWGVGVASRGKLRGLSLPIAKSAPAYRDAPSRTRSSSIIDKLAGQGRSRALSRDDVKVKLEAQSPLPGTTFTTYDFINMIPNSPGSSMQTDWTMSVSQDYLRPSQISIPEQASHQHLLRQSLQRLHTPSLSHDMNLSSSAPLSAYSEHDYGSPMDQAYQLDDGPFLASPAPLYSNYSAQHSPVDNGPFGMDARGPTSCPDQFYAQSDMSSSLSSHHQTLYELDETRHLAASPAGGYSRSDTYYDDETSVISTSHDSDSYISHSHHSSNSWNPILELEYSHPRSSDRFRTSNPESVPLQPQAISPRLSFYLNYYEKIICPITVAIDSPTNPYRHQILSLAAGSESLQHAICALSSCNLRMRRKQSTASAQWLHPLDLEIQESTLGSSTEALLREIPYDIPTSDSAIQEEYHHRTLAVQLLNSQLSDPAKAKDDSVLATLFILCHYRMCESGIAQFKTQFAGVKKLMGMRENGIETGKWGWMESIFTFFDAITATINDRESQLRGGYLDMVARASGPDLALENLAGCDGKLFKTIATLGRLNLLSQQRPVLVPLTNSSPITSSLPPRPRLAGQALADYYRVNPQKFDGNGFATTLTDDEIIPPFPSSPPYPAEDDLRAQFWHEWQGTRHALQTWEFDSTSLSSGLPVSPTSAHVRDFAAVSEAFRYAALLYTERLASPSLPSGSSNFQDLVQRVLGWASSLTEGSTAEKFLLWPVFVAGSEAVTGAQRVIVRSLCGGIAGRGGYGNNMSALRVLEKVWDEEDESRRGSAPSVKSNGLASGGFGAVGKSPFKWTRWMEGAEGEFIMV